MDFFKKDHEGQIINFVTLPRKECDKIYASFCSAYKIRLQERDDIFSFIQNRGHCIDFMNAGDESFDLYRLIYEQNTGQMPSRLNVCWDSFYTIDIFDLNDIINFFDYIWYPAADDVIIFDESYKICLLVRHDGVIYILDKER